MIAILIFDAGLLSQTTLNGAIRGKVFDVQGALIQGATVTVKDSIGGERTALSDTAGEFSMTNIPAGNVGLTVSAPGFALYKTTEIVVTAGKTLSIDISLSITVAENVTVGDDEPINTDPGANASAIVLQGKDLDALPDNDAELEAALQALAGPSAGPNGGEIFVDGFSGGRLPSKDTIREIRINQNPFSSEYDRPGFGRIEILTKPGTDKWRGEIESEFEDESLNSRNPFSANRPPFQIRALDGNLGGPIVKKRASFFFDAEYEATDNNSLIFAQILGPALVTQPFQQSVLSPSRSYEYSPRLDFQIDPNNTLVVRYFGESSKTLNAGLNGFDLPSRGYSTKESDSTLRISETSILSSNIINETKFQYIRRRGSQTSSDGSPTIRVNDAFTGGGANIGNAYNNDDRFEVQNFTTVVRGNHLVKFGGRFRRVDITDSSPNNFAGTFTFTTLEQYRNTILGMAGARPTQFSIAGGEPVAEVNRTDIGLFFQDDWKVRPNLTLSYGLRYEAQTNISDRTNIAPRLSLAYSPGGDGKSRPKTVFRVGFGVFYDRFGEGLTLQTRRYNGVNQQQFVVTDPAILSQPVFAANGTVTNVPTVQTLTAFAQPQTTRVVSPGLHAPRTTQLAFSIERQLPYKTTFSATYVYSNTGRLLRSRNINAPVGGVRPIPTSGNIFQYESTGRFNQHQLLLNFRSNLSERVSIFGNYALGKAKSDSDGVGTFPANQYDVTGEYGDASVDIRHRFVFGSNIKAPLGIDLSPFFTFRSGVPFNIITGTDNNADTLFTDRPSFASSPTEAGIINTRFGAFDPTPEPGDSIVPRNYGRGPEFLIMNLRIAKEFGFGGGKKSSKAAQTGGDNRTGTASPFGMNQGRPQIDNDDDEESPYKLEFSMQIRNLFNRNNGGVPVGNLSSTLFGNPVNTASGFGFGGGRQSGGNRRLRLEVQFSF